MKIQITPLICTAIAAALGFYFLSFIHIAVSIIVVSILFILLCLFRALVSLDEDNRRMQLISSCCTALAIGLFLGICAAAAGKNEVNFSIPENKVTAIEGILLEDPRLLSSGSAIVSVSLLRCSGDNNLRATSSGEITVFFPSESAEKLRQFGRGTQVYAEGRLRTAETGVTLSAVSLHITKTAPALERMRTGIRLNLIDKFEGKSWGGLALALLLGIKDNLDVSLSTMYRDAGLSFVLALSGMHLAVLAAIIAFLLKKPLGLKAASIAGAFLILLYCFIVGPMPSLIRAAIMYIIGVLAIIWFLPKQPVSILCLSFLIQIIITPSAGNSVSFVLSYLALAGILLIGKPIYSLLAGKIPDFVLQPLSASFGAFLATAGVCSVFFGTIAPAGIIIGLLIVPLTTVFMVGSMIWLLFDIFKLSGFLDIPLSLLYRLMERIVSVGGGLPALSITSGIIMPVSFLIILGIVVLEYRRSTQLFELKPFL